MGVTAMGRHSDLDILDQDRQHLVAARVRVAERLRSLRQLLGRAARETVPTWEQREARARIEELETIAGLLGTETS